MGYYDWTKDDVKNAIKSRSEKGKSSVALSMDKNSYENELEVVQWAKELGYEAKRGNERVEVKLT